MIFVNLVLLFVFGIVVGFLKDGSGVVVFVGVVGYFVLIKGIVVIDKDINMGVFGGIVLGVMVGLLYNCFLVIKLFEWFGFFVGKWFVLIIMLVVMFVFVGIFGVIWLLI